jgi:hypothetical protein
MRRNLSAPKHFLDQLVFSSRLVAGVSGRV